MRRYLFLLGYIFMLSSCHERLDLAPVVELYGERMHSNASYHIVHRYDTLYAIAFRYDQSYQTLALLNHLTPPYKLYVGQSIRLKPDAQFHPVLKVSHSSKHISTFVKVSSPKWVWPTRVRRVVTYFSPTAGQKGIDIVGRSGDKVYAANSGVIAYAGDGLTGYGNLIIIKHDNQLLTAYGHNAHNLVKEGQYVRAGQMIATMGMLDRGHCGLHFEIRQWGKPVNPLKYV